MTKEVYNFPDASPTKGIVEKLMQAGLSFQEANFMLLCYQAELKLEREDAKGQE